jgi:hypothetical protein
MAGKYGRAGQSTRKMAANRRTSARIFALIGIAAIILIAALLLNAKAFGISGIGMLVLLVLMRFVIPDLAESQISRKVKAEKRAIRGAKAEENIGEILDDLSEDYVVLHDIDSPYGNIDHIVISKHSGIFLLETKSHRGRVEVQNDRLLVNGKPPERNFIGQALSNSYWLREEICKVIGEKPWITPIVVFTNAFVAPTRPIKGVSIANKKYLTTLLQRPGRPNSMNAQIWDAREEIADRLV